MPSLYRQLILFHHSNIQTSLYTPSFEVFFVASKKMRSKIQNFIYRQLDDNSIKTYFITLITRNKDKKYTIWQFETLDLRFRWPDFLN